jgi:hypothetical protein
LFADISAAGLEARIPPTRWEDEGIRGEVTQGETGVSTVVTESCPGSHFDAISIFQLKAIQSCKKKGGSLFDIFWI